MLKLFARLFRRKPSEPVDFRKLMPSTQLVAVTVAEGGTWFEFPLIAHKWARKSRFGVKGILIHSMLFEDGSTWDARNGWRSRRIESSYILLADGNHKWWYARGAHFHPAAGFVKP